MMNIKHTVILLCGGLALSGCLGTNNRGVDSVHQPVVSRADYAFDLASDGTNIDPNEISRLSGWFTAMKLGYGDHVSIDPNGAYDLSGVSSVVGTLAARYGLLVDQAAPITTGQIPQGHVRIVISRMTARVPGCPDWSRDAQWDFENNTSSNFGCATNSNLSAMVADPSELVSGRANDGTGSPVSNARSTKAIQAQRGK
jgi:pilus assembly protein CpaD